MADSTTAVVQSARDQGLLVEAMALRTATTASGDTDLLARAQTLYANVVDASSNAFSTWKLYAPAFLGGGYQDEADAIAAEYQKRHGVDPLAVQIPPPTGPLAEVASLASGQATKAADTGATIAAQGVGTGLAAIGDSLTKYGKYLFVALVLLLIAFLAMEAANIVRAVKE